MKIERFMVTIHWGAYRTVIREDLKTIEEAFQCAEQTKKRYKRRGPRGPKAEVNIWELLPLNPKAESPSSASPKLSNH